MADLPRAFGPYVLLKPLGASGTSDVFLARPLDPHKGIPTPIVIKRLHGELAAQDEFYSRFMHEAQIAVEAQCPHLPKVFDVGRVGESVYIAMEFLNGWTIARLIADLQTAGRQASISSVADVIAGALTALHALHTSIDKNTGQPLGIIHRDIAPKNVLVGEDGVTRLIDFGLGKSRLEEWKTETGVVLGTPGYMAPEQVQAQAIDQRADVYAMGIVAWELLTLRSFIRRGPVPLMLRAQASPVYTPPSQIRGDVPKDIDEVLRRALEADPARRFQSALEFFHALRAAVPRDDSLDPLPTLVGEMLWGQLEQEKSQITQIVSSSNNHSSTPVVVDATATDGTGRRLPAGVLVSSGSNMPMVQPVDSYPGENTIGQRPLHTPPGMQGLTPPGAMMPPMTSPLPMHPAPSKGVRLEIVLAMLAATLVLGVTVGLLLRDSGGPQVVVMPAGADEPAAAPLPAVVPSAQTARAEEKVPERIEPVREVRPSRAKSARTVQPAEPRETAAAVVAPAGNPRERANALIKRAKALKAKLSAGSDAEARATSLINRLAMEASSSDTDGARLGALEAELTKLEAAH